MGRSLASVATFIVGLLAACMPAAAQITVVPTFEVMGRLGVSEPHSCDGGTYPNYAFTNSSVSWTECHALKRHIDPVKGAPIRDNFFVPDAIRPLQMSVDVETRCVYGKSADLQPIASVRAQTDRDGNFRVAVPLAPCRSPTERPDGLLVIVSAVMLYEVTDSAGNGLGTLRGLAYRPEWEAVYSSVLGPEPSVLTNPIFDLVIPRLLLAYQTLPVRPPPVVDLGSQFFFDGASPYFFDPLRATLSHWQTHVDLHDRLQAALAVDGHDWMYSRMFQNDPAWACHMCYSVSLPVAAASSMYLGIVSIGLAAHEFGHAIHGLIAPDGFVVFDNAWVTGEDTAGARSYSRQLTLGLQMQDMGLALVEGFANAMGRYFLNGCGITDRAWGPPSPRQAELNPRDYAWCDSMGEFCPYRIFRFLMSERGIAEGDPTWTHRVDALAKLADDAHNAGAILVASNNETKVANFLCDLLDDDSDVSYAAGQIGGRTYVPDYAWNAAERIDGRKPPLAFATYASDPPPETVRLTLGQILDALGAFVPAGSYPGPFPSPIVDGANQARNDARMSIDGPYSMQAFADYLVNHAVVTRADVNGILRGNRMEEIP